MMRSNARPATYRTTKRRRIERRYGQLLGRVKRLESHDGFLTQLLNKKTIKDLIESADHPIGVICIDINKFKSVNDRIGYSEGDKLLKAIEEKISSLLTRQGDAVCRINGVKAGRFGGDEFLIIIDVTEYEDRSPALAQLEAVVAMLRVLECELREEHPAATEQGFGLAIGGVLSADFTTALEALEAAEREMKIDKGKNGR